MPAVPDTTLLLQQLRLGQPGAAEQLFPLVYDELRALADHYLRRESKGHTLQPTALVHEAFLKLVGQASDWTDRTHFIAISARAMRQILVDHARHKKRSKRGGGRQRIALEESLQVSVRHDEDVLAVDEALQELETLDPRQARIVELRFFGGLTVEETAEVLGVSKRTVEAEWTVVRAWLRQKLE